LRHIDKAQAAGVDGIVLLTAGSGGQTGWANPFAFTRAARARFDGLIALAGGVADGTSIAAARMLGADLAYCGTRFIATTESSAPAEYKAALRDAELDDVVMTDEITGLPASFLRGALAVAAASTTAAVERFNVSTSLQGANGRPSRWTNAWSAGHGVSLIDDTPSVAELVETLAKEYGRASALR
jgi:nitronate monooxygenase